MIGKMGINFGYQMIIKRKHEFYGSSYKNELKQKRILNGGIEYIVNKIKKINILYNYNLYSIIGM